MEIEGARVPDLGQASPNSDLLDRDVVSDAHVDVTAATSAAVKLTDAGDDVTQWRSESIFSVSKADVGSYQHSKNLYVITLSTVDKAPRRGSSAGSADAGTVSAKRRWDDFCLLRGILVDRLKGSIVPGLPPQGSATASSLEIFVQKCSESRVLNDPLLTSNSPVSPVLPRHSDDPAPTVVLQLCEPLKDFATMTESEWESTYAPKGFMSNTKSKVHGSNQRLLEALKTQVSRTTGKEVVPERYASLYAYLQQMEENVGAARQQLEGFFTVHGEMVDDLGEVAARLEDLAAVEKKTDASLAQALTRVAAFTGALSVKSTPPPHGGSERHALDLLSHYVSTFPCVRTVLYHIHSVEGTLAKKRRQLHDLKMKRGTADGAAKVNNQIDHLTEEVKDLASSLSACESVFRRDWIDFRMRLKDDWKLLTQGFVQQKAATHLACLVTEYTPVST
eukprot:Rhum_TRINITY_DN1182_c0_g1::Rhum_TRINITY_DN1182_c0_g1_i1::g.3645::m.3645/K17921/SNX7_30; sorting nexin-7/30